MFSVSFFKSWATCNENPDCVLQRNQNETSCSAGLAVNHTSCAELQGIFPFSIPTQESQLIFLLQNSASQLLNFSQRYTVIPQVIQKVYLDLGNEFGLDCPQIRAIHIRLRGYLLCGKHRIIFTTQVVPLAKQAEGNRNEQKLVRRNVFVAAVPPQLISTVKKKESE